MNVPTSPAGRKPARAAAHTARAKRPRNDLAKKYAVAVAVASSPLNTDALAIVKAAEELLELVERVLDQHGSSAFVKAIRAAGAGPVDIDYFIGLAQNVLNDVEGLRYNLESAIAFISSELIDAPARPPAATADDPR